MKIIAKKGYFEIYKEDKCIGRFINLTIKNQDKILKDLKKKDAELVKYHYNDYVKSINKHNSIVNQIKTLIHDKKNLEEIINLRKKIKTTEGFDIIHDIIVKNYVFTGNFI